MTAHFEDKTLDCLLMQNTIVSWSAHDLEWPAIGPALTSRLSLDKDGLVSVAGQCNPDQQVLPAHQCACCRHAKLAG